MKKLLLATMLAGVAATGTYAQGLIAVDNENANQAGTATATTAGLFFDSNGTPYTGASLNITVLGGASASSLSPIVTLSGSSGFVYIGIPGEYADGGGLSYSVPGVAGQGNAFLQVEVWTGSASSYAAALTTAGSEYATSPVFATATGGTSPTAPPAPPVDLVGMPAVVLATPEPSTIALGGLGAAALMFFRRRK